MDLIDNLSDFVLILIRLGAVFRVTFCIVRMITADEEAPQFKKRIRNILTFYIIAESVFIIKDLLFKYFA